MGPLISFVGAGPGAADLLTVRAARRLAEADVVVWASSLVDPAVLGHCRSGIEVHDSAGMTLEDVLAVYAAAGGPVVRLHSGDLSVFSSLQEQVEWCLDNERPFEIVPGVGSLAAASAAVGRELTVPAVSQTVVLGRLANRTAATMGPSDRLADYAALRPTMAVYLSAARPEALEAELHAAGEGYPPDTPAAVVVRASWPDERVVLTTVGRLAEAVRSTGARTHALVLVGEALAGAAARCLVYDPSHAHGHRRRSEPGSTAGRPR